MKSLRIASVLAAGVLAIPAFAQTPVNPSDARGQSNPPRAAGQANNDTAATASDLNHFAHEAAMGGMAEVELGKLAVTKATNSAVRDFGQRMIDDHSKANDELRAAATRSGVTLPTDVDAKQKKTYDKLNALSGNAFDRAYMSDMVKDHKEDVALFEKAAREPGDSPLKTFAAETLPTLREHLRMAEQAKKGLGEQVQIPPTK